MFTFTSHFMTQHSQCSFLYIGSLGLSSIKQGSCALHKLLFTQHLLALPLTEVLRYSVSNAVIICMSDFYLGLHKSCVHTHTHTHTYGTRLPLAVLNVTIVIIKRVVSKGERVGGTGCTRLGKARRANIISYLYTTCIIIIKTLPTNL